MCLFGECCSSSVWCVCLVSVVAVVCVCVCLFGECCSSSVCVS